MELAKKTFRFPKRFARGLEKGIATIRASVPITLNS